MKGDFSITQVHATKPHEIRVAKPRLADEFLAHLIRKAQNMKGALTLPGDVSDFRVHGGDVDVVVNSQSHHIEFGSKTDQATTKILERLLRYK